MSESDPEPERPRPGSGEPSAFGPEEPGSPVAWLQWFWRTDHGAVSYVREILTSVGAVLLVGLLLFAVSGLWPPMVAIESPSMEPNMKTGDLVFVMEEHRLAPGSAYAETGVVTYRTGQETGYTKFAQGGDVIVYQPDGNAATTPIIHRAMFYVNASENWYDKAVAVDPRAVGGADDCGELDFCPAPHGGFITKGDNVNTNRHYDQVSGLSAPVRPAWVVGTAEFRIPLLGNIRLWASGTVDAPTPWAVEPAVGAPTGPHDGPDATASNATAADPTAAV
ncbi:S26 family signal peptidase [Salinirubellus salinus]|uniref:S26 family signal peptidase n=1 Tax=Salinirubellus salinus TaxID=1364945 RepID=A0A9E7U769_9EURY|nr:S26 family signal peptidase [Salinirubellus salinus]UWM53251.1 S26 family signal peptidase [Salinirubellus salinus]